MKLLRTCKVDFETEYPTQEYCSHLHRTQYNLLKHFAFKDTEVDTALELQKSTGNFTQDGKFNIREAVKYILRQKGFIL